MAKMNLDRVLKTVSNVADATAAGAETYNNVNTVIKRAQYPDRSRFVNAGYENTVAANGFMPTPGAPGAAGGFNFQNGNFRYGNEDFLSMTPAQQKAAVNSSPEAFIKAFLTAGGISNVPENVGKLFSHQRKQTSILGSITTGSNREARNGMLELQESILQVPKEYRQAYADAVMLMSQRTGIPLDGNIMANAQYASGGSFANTGFGFGNYFPYANPNSKAYKAAEVINTVGLGAGVASVMINSFRKPKAAEEDKRAAKEKNPDKRESKMIRVSEEQPAKGKDQEPPPEQADQRKLVA